MSTDSRQGPETVSRIDHPSSGSRPYSTEFCSGCRELTARVEQLERAMGEREAGNFNEQLGTTACYWSCVGVHALIGFILFLSDETTQLGLSLSLGSLATLVVCQVFSTRPIHVRGLRSLLSASVVTVASILGMWMGDVADPSDVAPLLLVYFPPIFAVAWFTAKLFVWTRKWRIVPPRSSQQYPRLQIQHLMLCTLMVAGYFATGRMMDIQIYDWIDESELFPTLLYLGIPLVLSVTVSSLLAKIVLTTSGKNVASRVLALAFGTSLAMAFFCIMIVPLVTDYTFDWGTSSGIFVYLSPMGVFLFMSSGGTFAMMRLAQYRFMSG